jgi:hypothetical protein
MARRGRKPSGTNLLEHLAGSTRAKARLKAILETLSGERTIPDVCAELGIRESMFHRVRSEVLQTAIDRLEPRPMGRPPILQAPEQHRVIELEEQLERLQLELRATEIRRELAEKLPRLARDAETAADPGAAAKKTKLRAAKRRRQRLRQRMKQDP